MGNIVGGLVGGLLSKKSGGRQSRDILAAGRAGAEQFAPFQEAGVSANADILGALQGSAGSDQAFQNFLNSTGFQSQLSAGSQAITGNAATEGLLNSGATLKRLNTFGQDLAQGGFQNFLGNLGNVAQRGIQGAAGASQALVGSGTNAAAAAAGGRQGQQAGFGQALGGITSLLGI